MSFSNNRTRFATLLVLSAFCSLSFVSCRVNLLKSPALTGWTLRGGTGIFQIKDGVLIGTTPKGESPTSYLCTNKEYGDFILELDTRVDEGFNSGVQIRSKLMTAEDAKRLSDNLKEMMARMPPPPPNAQRGAGPPQPSANRGPQISAGKVWGPQVEIVAGGKTDSTLAGYIFGENMIPKFWLSDRKTMKKHTWVTAQGWNHYKIACKGPRI